MSKWMSGWMNKWMEDGTRNNFLRVIAMLWCTVFLNMLVAMDK